MRKHLHPQDLLIVKAGDFEAKNPVGFGKAAPDKRYPVIFAAGSYAGVQGIFHSDDIGESWVRINDGEHQYGNRFRADLVPVLSQPYLMFEIETSLA